MNANANANPMTTDPTTGTPLPILMSVSFDVEQYGDTMCWNVTEGTHNLMQQSGKLAGSLKFERGAPFGFAVRCWGPAGLQSFHVMSAVLATIPASTDLPPSPFVGVSSATYPVDGFPIVSGPPQFDAKEQRYYLDCRLGPTAVVVDMDGGWHLKFVITVQITTTEGGVTTTVTRVFDFDPESQVGNGTR